MSGNGPGSCGCCGATGPGAPPGVVPPFFPTGASEVGTVTGLVDTDVTALPAVVVPGPDDPPSSDPQAAAITTAPLISIA
ncbi:hypothetical protein [Nocardia sp. IFM 10818]